MCCWCILGSTALAPWHVCWSTSIHVNCLLGTHIKAHDGTYCWWSSCLKHVGFVLWLLLRVLHKQLFKSKCSTHRSRVSGHVWVVFNEGIEVFPSLGPLRHVHWCCSGVWSMARLAHTRTQHRHHRLRRINMHHYGQDGDCWWRTSAPHTCAPHRHHT